MTERLSIVETSLLSARLAGHRPSLKLAVSLYLPPKMSTKLVPGLIVGHGAGSRRSRHVSFCLEACNHGFAVLALDFRGHGNSEGESDGPLELDLYAAARFLRAYPGVDPDRICYRGSSMGGFYGLKAAPEAGFTAMALLCPASEQVILEAIADGEVGDTEDHARPQDSTALPRWNTAGLRTYFEQQNSRLLAGQVDCPVLLIHARADEVVPFAHSLLLAEHLRTETVLIALKDGTHASAQHNALIHAHTSAWLTEKVDKILA